MGAYASLVPYSPASVVIVNAPTTETWSARTSVVDDGEVIEDSDPAAPNDPHSACHCRNDGRRGPTDLSMKQYRRDDFYSRYCDMRRRESLLRQAEEVETILAFDPHPPVENTHWVALYRSDSPPTSPASQISS